MSECVFKPGQTYKTRDGREALIYCNDAPGPYSIHGRLSGRIASWTPSGAAVVGSGGAPDLIPPAPPRIRERIWCNVYSNGPALHPAKEIALGLVAPGVLRIAVPCMLIEIVDGEPGE